MPVQKTVNITEVIKCVTSAFRRPFTIKDVNQLLEHAYELPINKNTMLRYIHNYVSTGTLKKSQWSQGSINYYANPISNEKEAAISCLLDPNSTRTTTILHGMINPLLLIEISHIHRYLPFDSPLKNEISKYYASVNYEESEKSFQFAGTNNIVIQAFTSDVADAIEITDDDKIVGPTNDLRYIKIRYITNAEKKLFFTIKGEYNLELYRKALAFLTVKKGAEEAEKIVSKYPQIVTIVLDDVNNAEERSKIVNDRLFKLNEPEPKEIVTFKTNMVEALDLTIKQAKAREDPEKREKMAQYEIEIEKKKKLAKSINADIKRLESEKESILDE